MLSPRIGHEGENGGKVREGKGGRNKVEGLRASSTYLRLRGMFDIACDMTLNVTTRNTALNYSTQLNNESHRLSNCDPTESSIADMPNAEACYT